jgi:hypothetical protein
MTKALKIVKQDNVYETIHSYISDSSKEVTNYEEMIEVVLDMIKSGHCFLMDRDILRDALETLTFMYEPNDDMNKDRVILQLIDVDDDDEDDEDGEDAGMDMLKNLGKMMGMPDMPDMSGMEGMMKGEEETPAPDPTDEGETPAPDPTDEGEAPDLPTEEAPDPPTEEAPAPTEEAPAPTEEAPDPPTEEAPATEDQ